MSKTDFDFYKATTVLLIAAYVVYFVYIKMYGKLNTPLAISCLFNNYLIKIFVAIMIIVLIYKSEYLLAISLFAVFCLTFNEIQENFGVSGGISPAALLPPTQVQPEFGDSPVGKAFYVPDENYIGGIYGYGGHLQYEQMPVVPP